MLKGMPSRERRRLDRTSKAPNKPPEAEIGSEDSQLKLTVMFVINYA